MEPTSQTSQELAANGAAPDVRLLPPLDLAPLDFREDLSPIEVPVDLSRWGFGRYVLREASVPAGIQYENFQARSLRFDDGKMAGLGDMYEADLLLLSLCLHPVDEATGEVKTDRGGNPLPTPRETIKAFPARAYKMLVAKCKEVNPALERKETPDSLRKQIANLQKRLAEVEAKEPAAKN